MLILQSLFFLQGLYPTGLGRWDKHIESLTQAGQDNPWQDKLSKGFFRGSRTSSDRDPLVLLSRYYLFTW